MTLFCNFLKIWAIGAISSLIPWLQIGLVLGFAAYTIAAILVTLVFRKELS